MVKSYSHSSGASLPGARPRYEDRAPNVGDDFNRSRDPFIAAQLDAEASAKAKLREAFMLKREQPRPVLQPSPSLSADVDAAVFNERWRAAHDAANREARKTDFRAKRQAQTLKRVFNRAH